LSKPRDAAINDPRIDPGDRLVVDAQPVLDIRAVVLDHNIATLRQLEEDFAAFLALEIERHRALVSVQVLEVKTVTVAANNIPVG
jgi:hypothetical protein